MMGVNYVVLPDNVVDKFKIFFNNLHPFLFKIKSEKYFCLLQNIIVK